MASVRSETVIRITDKVRRAIVAAYGGKCQYCGEVAAPAHIDHIVARAIGGKDDLLNFTLACEKCNLRKNALRLPVAYEGLLLAIAEQKLSAVLAQLNTITNPKSALKIVEAKPLEKSYKFLDCRGIPQAARESFFALASIVRENKWIPYGNGGIITDERLNAYKSGVKALQEHTLDICCETPRGRRWTGMLRIISGTVYECKDITSREDTRLAEVNLSDWVMHSIQTYSDADLNQMFDAGILPYQKEFLS